MSTTQPSPDWWQASDGLWYPPQSAPGATPPPPPAFPVDRQPASSGRGKGCLIGCVAVLAVLVLVGGVAAFFLVRAANHVAHTVSDTTHGLNNLTDGKGNLKGLDLSCPPAAKVSEVLGTTMELGANGSVVVGAGCEYTDTTANTTSVTVIAVPNVIDGPWSGFKDSAQSAGAHGTSANVGEKSLAYAESSTANVGFVKNSTFVDVAVSASSTPGLGRAIAIAKLVADQIR